MNFLELCQSVRQESGVSGQGPTSVLNQVGIHARIVNWVQKANIDVQLVKTDWSFLWDAKDSNLQTGVSSYLSGDLSVPDIKHISAFLAEGRSLEIVTWDWWTYHIRRTGFTSKTGFPSVVCIDPAGKIHVNPTPDRDIDVSIDYYRKPVALVNNLDKPAIPEIYHQAIVERALMFYADYEEDQYLYAKKEIEYQGWLARMAADLLPEVHI